MIKMPATSTAGGTCFAFPDTCLTPAPPSPSPVPIPYPNTAQLAMAQSTVTKVMIENKQTVVQDSKVPRSMGDEAGVNGGVTSGTFGGEVAFKQASSKVFADGKKMVMLTAMTGHNGSSSNAPAGLIVAPSQMKVLISM